MTNYLAIDYGSKNIGLAYKLSPDPIVPSDIIPNRQINQSIKIILKFCQKKSIHKIVIGLPLSLDGSIGPQAEIIQKFSDQLSRATDLPLVLFDERYSSKIFSVKDHPIDNYSAAAILENYLSYLQSKK